MYPGRRFRDDTPDVAEIDDSSDFLASIRSRIAQNAQAIAHSQHSTVTKLKGAASVLSTDLIIPIEPLNTPEKRATVPRADGYDIGDGPNVRYGNNWQSETIERRKTLYDHPLYGWLHMMAGYGREKQVKNMFSVDAATTRLSESRVRRELIDQQIKIASQGIKDLQQTEITIQKEMDALTGQQEQKAFLERKMEEAKRIGRKRETLDRQLSEMEKDKKKLEVLNTIYSEWVLEVPQKVPPQVTNAGFIKQYMINLHELWLVKKLTSRDPLEFSPEQKGVLSDFMRGVPLSSVYYLRDRFRAFTDLIAASTLSYVAGQRIYTVLGPGRGTVEEKERLVILETLSDSFYAMEQYMNLIHGYARDRTLDPVFGSPDQLPRFNMEGNDIANLELLSHYLSELRAVREEISDLVAVPIVKQPPLKSGQTELQILRERETAIKTKVNDFSRRIVFNGYTVDSVDQLVKEYDLHINVLAYLQQSSNVNSSADLWMSKFGYSVIRASNTIQSSKIEAAKSALAVAEQSLIAQKTQARQQEEQLEALIEKINSIDENLQRLQYNLRQRKAQVALENKKLLQLPNDLYTHDHEYASRPENNGVIDVDPMVMGVIREAYGLLASYVQWPRNDANDKPVLDMMKDQSLRDDFAKIAGYKYQLAKADSSGSYSQRGALQRLDARIAAVLVNYESHNDMLQDTIYMGAGSGYRVTGLNPVYPAHGTPVSFVNRLMKK